jgi:hypothetical protein
MQLPPENPASERFIGYMIIQASAHHEYCLFKIKALLLRMTLKHHSHGAPKPTGQRTDMGDASSAMLRVDPDFGQAGITGYLLYPSFTVI